MFQSGFKVDSSLQMSGADRQVFRDLLRLKFDNLTQQDVETILPKNDTFSITKITTRSGKEVIVYCIADRAMFFLFENTFLPTVYSLWKLPKIGVVFTTNDLVVSNILKGADMMISEIYNNPANNTDFDEQEIGIVNCLSNRAMIAVGLTTMSSTKMLGTKHGKVLEIYHYYGDGLCSLHNLFPLQIPKQGRPQDSIDIAADLLKQLTDIAISLPTCCDSSTMTNNDVPEEQFIGETPEAWAKEEQDELVVGPSGMQRKPALATIDTATSSSEEQDEPVAGPSGMQRKKALASIDTATSSSEEQDEPVAGPSGMQRKPALATIATTTSSSSLLPLATGGSTKTGAVKKVIPVKKRRDVHVAGSSGLQRKKDFGTIDTTSSLLSLATGGSSDTDQGACKKTYAKTKKQDKQVPGQSGTHRKLMFEPVKDVFSTGSQESIGTGKLAPITMKMETRSGKDVTVIGNIELYGIDIIDFAEKCQLGVGASTIAVRSTKEKPGYMTIQGNQINFVSELLAEKYNISKSDIEGLEFAAKK